ncbi:MAG: peptide-binding protein [Pararhodobacter sp.]|nr:peptide-binding protein [Pararhodobacter sp.]
MLRVLSILTALLLATAATAQDFPALYRVTGVAANDVLNIRAEPSARTPIVGSFAPDQTGIEVVGLSEDRRWGLVRSDEGVGWSAMRFLSRERADGWQDGQQHLTCAGTEPFWRLDLFLPTNRAEFHDIDSGGFEVRTNAPDLNRTRFPATLAMTFVGARQGFAAIRQGICSDGMSDRLFGLEVQVYWLDDPQGLSGCCNLGH